MIRIFKTLATGILLLAFSGCKPDDKSPGPKGWACSFDGAPLIYNDHGSTVVLATAFTPNGDGVNDLFRVIHNNIQTSNFLLEIQTPAGADVFSTTLPGDMWDGSSNSMLLSGVNYRLRLRFTAADGTQVDTCSGVTPFLYDRSSDCLPVYGKTYYFEDQYDGVAGFPYQTGEHLCP